MKFFNCTFCNTENAYCRNNRNKYCDNVCQGKHRRQLGNLSVEAGTATSNLVKKYLIEKHGAKCMKCGWNEVNTISNNVPIELEHIDGNSENNSLENVILLCPNCHSLTPTYKALNRGNGRHSRMVRYNDGKSF